jgi:A1 cistron-splicing factor AAR2
MDSPNKTDGVLLLDVPHPSLVGIDLIAFTTGATGTFRGIKHIPAGLHFVFTSASESLSIRHGSWFRVPEEEDHAEQEPPLFIKRWVAHDEALVSVHDAAELARRRRDLPALWRTHLTPYRQSTLTLATAAAAANDVTDGGTDDEGTAVASEETAARDESAQRAAWEQLTDCVSDGVLTRITGREERDGWALTTASSAKRDRDDGGIPGLGGGGGEAGTTAGRAAAAAAVAAAAAAAAAGKEGDVGGGAVEGDEPALNFLPVDLQRTWPRDATGRARTDAARDRSWALSALVAEHLTSDANDALLGELQFAFVGALALDNHSCLEQWKRLVRLLLTCRAAVAERPHLFAGALRALRLQLKHARRVVEGGGLFDAAELATGLLRDLLRRFKKGLDDVEGLGKEDVVDELDELQDFLRAELQLDVDDEFLLRRGMTVTLEDGERVELATDKYDEEDERGEYAPTVVELTPQQRKDLGEPDADAEDAQSLGSEDGSEGDPRY